MYPDSLAVRDAQATAVDVAVLFDVFAGVLESSTYARRSQCTSFCIAIVMLVSEGNEGNLAEGFRDPETLLKVSVIRKPC